MAKQLFSEGMMKMANIPLDEEMDSMENSLKKESEQGDSSSEYKKIEDLIRQTKGRLDVLDVAKSSTLTELPEGIISAEEMDLAFSQIKKLPASLKRVNILYLSDSKIAELPANLQVEDIDAKNCKDLKSIPSYRRMIYLTFEDSGVEEIGQYPQLEQLYCENTPFAEKAIQEAESQGIDVEEYIKKKCKLPEACEVYL